MTDRPATITAPPPIVQTIRAYARAAAVGHGRPAVALGGRADLTASPDVPELPELAQLAEEADGYARAWRAQESARLFAIGRPTYADRPALVYVVEAARALTARNRDGAARLLRLALTELEATR